MARRIPLSARLFPQARKALRRFRTDLSAWTTPGGTPNSFHAAKVEGFAGVPADGADILEGEWHRFGQSLEVEPSALWTTPLPSLRFASWLHCFEWLDGVAALDNAAARVRARQLVDGWVEEYGQYHSFAWEPDRVARRLYSWMLHWSPVLNTDNLSDLAAGRRASALKQGRFLRRNLSRLPKGIPEIRALVALSMLGARWPRGDGMLAFAQSRLSEALGQQILPDGGHVSRSPEAALSVLRWLKALDALLDARGVAVDPSVTRATDRLAPMAAFFSHTDGGLAAFHGSGEGETDRIATLLEGLPSKPFAFAPHSHYQRLDREGTTVIIDVGGPPPFPFDGEAHLSPLAFEMSVPEGRLITACGWSSEQPAQWRQPVRMTAAHSALEMPEHKAGRFLDPDTIATSLRRPVIARGGDPVSADRREAEPGIIVQGSHHAYVPATGLVHSRRLFLASDGGDLRGEDRLAPPPGAVTPFKDPIEVVIRFHLYPGVKAGLAKDKRHVWLKPDMEGAPWVFLFSGGDADLSLALESSAYLGKGVRPQPTEQIVVRGRAVPGENFLVRWALRRKRPVGSADEGDSDA